jgi:hypothetical protein
MNGSFRATFQRNGYAVSETKHETLPKLPQSRAEQSRNRTETEQSHHHQPSPGIQQRGTAGYPTVAAVALALP